MMTEIITALVGVICTILGSCATFVLTKKKYNTEVDSQIIQNMNEASNAYKKIMEETLKLHSDKIKMLEKENEDLRAQVNHLQKQLTNLLLANLQPDPQRIYSHENNSGEKVQED